MTIAIGSDHGGFSLKEKLIEFLRKERYKVKDFGTNSPKSCDYPEIGYRLAKEVSLGKIKRGILVCKTGIGFSIVANKVPGTRAALCHNLESAKLSREHNDSNILVLGASFVKEGMAKDMVKVWLHTKFLGGRHARRIQQIEDIEKKLRGLR
jgi:ribose 5-phosphate isomerase B